MEKGKAIKERDDNDEKAENGVEKKKEKRIPLLLPSPSPLFFHSRRA